MDPSKKTKLKLLVDRATDHVLFAEAGKDAVNFLHNLLGVPLGVTLRAIAVSPLPAEENMMAGCLDQLYTSLLDLDSAYLIHGKPSSESLFPLIPSSSQSPASQKYYRCSGRRQKVYGGLDKYHCSCFIPKYRYTSTQCTGDHLYLTDAYGTVCPSCREIMTTEMTLLADAGEHKKNKGTVDKDKGYVKGGAIYMVMDDLTVTPIGSVCEALDQLGVVDLSLMYELTVDLGPEEGLQLLKTSLFSSSKTVLTDVFLRKQRESYSSPK